MIRLLDAAYVVVDSWGLVYDIISWRGGKKG